MTLMEPKPIIQLSRGFLATYVQYVPKHRFGCIFVIPQSGQIVK